MDVLVAANAVQRMAGITFFDDLAAFLRSVWRFICKIGRIITFILACLFGASVPTMILLFVLWVMVGD